MPSVIGKQEGLHRWGWLRLLICFFVGVLLAAGCGPTRQQLMEMEKARVEADARTREAAEARRQAEEEARRQVTEARRQAEERIRASEMAADEAARQGQFGKALEQYREVLKNIQRYSEQDQRVRRAAIKAAQAMVAPPTLPENVLRYMVRGETKVKMGGAGSYEAAAQEMEQAILEAPWFADGYFNLGTIQDKSGKFNQAIQNFHLFLLAAPQSRSAVAVRAKIFGLEVMQEDAIKTLRLMGTWRDLNEQDEKRNQWGIRVKGGKLLIGNIHVEKKGRALEGFIEFDTHTFNNCVVPGGKRPVTGTISEDGTRMELHYERELYNTTSQGNLCIGVSHVGMESVNHNLVLEGPCLFCVDTEDLTQGKARSLGMQRTGGVLITEVYEGEPGDMAGLRQGDVIIACQGREIPDDATFVNTIKRAPIGSDVRVTFMRRGEQHDTVVKAGVYLSK